MNDIDPYKHIRALARSMADIEKQIDPSSPAERHPEEPAPQPLTRPDRGIGAFAETLRSAREQRGLTQRELGRLAGVPQSHISKIESGAVDLRLSSLLALARVLDLELVLAERDRPQEGNGAASLRIAETNQLPRGPARAASWHREPAEVPALIETGTQ